MSTRQDHLAWCKARALEYCDIDDTRGAMYSMLSDLDKHQETENHPASIIAVLLMASGGLNAQAEVRRFIEGFH